MQNAKLTCRQILIYVLLIRKLLIKTTTFECAQSVMK